MKADYLEFKDKCIQMLTEIDFFKSGADDKGRNFIGSCRLSFRRSI